MRVATDLDKAGVAQHLEVPRHAGLVHADGINEFVDRTLSAPYGIEDPSASRLGDRVEDIMPIYPVFLGAQSENRTRDLRITNALLYRLSYLGAL